MSQEARMTQEAEAQPTTLDGTPLTGRDLESLATTARRMRRDVLQTTFVAGSGHPGGSFSEMEVIVSLYHGGILRHTPKQPHHPDRDYFILSKGHACPGLYSVLADVGFFPREELWKFRTFGALLQGHVDRKIPGIEMSAGSLGMGLGYANGIALAMKLNQQDNRVYVMLGDGECQEGNIWESALTAAHRGLDNVTAILDANRVQIDGFVEDVKSLDPLADKWRAFGWRVIEIDGHDYEDIFHAFDTARATRGRPTIIIAHTVKGKGVSFMENNAEFHGRALKVDEMKRAMADLGAEWDEENGWKEVTA
jgi:transketolase